MCLNELAWPIIPMYWHYVRALKPRLISECKATVPCTACKAHPPKHAQLSHGHPASKPGCPAVSHCTTTHVQQVSRFLMRIAWKCLYSASKFWITQASPNFKFKLGCTSPKFKLGHTTTRVKLGRASPKFKLARTTIKQRNQIYIQQTTHLKRVGQRNFLTSWCKT